MPMLIDIAWRMAGVVVMLARLFLLWSLVAMTVLVQVPRLVSRMVVVLAGLFAVHVNVPVRQSRGSVRPRKQRGAHKVVPPRER